MLSFRQKRLTGKLAGLAATGAVRSLEVAVLDKITGPHLARAERGIHKPGA
ncbi:T6SS phospholipase effector Tle1-like catalytic domain-containing protein [Klebsiella pneumoniae]|uniref:T6SS phospholipase effector Tle1-like catalytic domain-containing protein n=1 Tax=Klebsiella pneumoniae TaxID=573 RepID=UPI0035B5AE44